MSSAAQEPKAGLQGGRLLEGYMQVGNPLPVPFLQLTSGTDLRRQYCSSSVAVL